MSDHDIQTLRSQAREIAALVVRRVIQDPAFAAELRSDPRATLSSVGLPKALTDDFIIHDLAMEPDVAGYRMADDCTYTCIWITCSESVSSAQP
jgi:hypothetical protein